ncbi:hypothetical protein BGW36DRAFT_50134 [Talaromyces proteolyticus]|uniref:Uncharacterized protein n=1 Tax=Talaromyces proteolyticus TaxID=1131652 RepID=A0AAD4KIT1_9EURO|nr:uncharacterized protein BGW36DRAFT_50134 [Talaromyces proteolyticus]KAH8691308.1 hypothetical protein BGW36DRAFT_50134 [Talaromyces proteolyticus]
MFGSQFITIMLHLSYGLLICVKCRLFPFFRAEHASFLARGDDEEIGRESVAYCFVSFRFYLFVLKYCCQTENS